MALRDPADSYFSIVWLLREIRLAHGTSLIPVK
jgi:hypothetical protein